MTLLMVPYVGSSRRNDARSSEHFDGSRWRHVATPPAVAFLHSVSDAGSEDVWAVGVLEDGDTDPYALHWDGAAWSNQSPPRDGRDAAFDAVEAVAADDVWAVGGVFDDSGSQALAEHWNDSAWSVVPTPVVQGAVETSLSGIHAMGRTMYGPSARRTAVRTGAMARRSCTRTAPRGRWCPTTLRHIRRSKRCQPALATTPGPSALAGSAMATASPSPSTGTDRAGVSSPARTARAPRTGCWE